MRGPGRLAKFLVVLGFLWWLVAVGGVLLGVALRESGTDLAGQVGFLGGMLAMGITWLYCLHYAYYRAPFDKDQRFGCILGLVLFAPLAVPYLIFAYIVRAPVGTVESEPSADAAGPQGVGPV
jgi:hypothetical protein